MFSLFNRLIVSWLSIVGRLRFAWAIVLGEAQRKKLIASLPLPQTKIHFFQRMNFLRIQTLDCYSHRLSLSVTCLDNLWFSFLCFVLTQTELSVTRDFLFTNTVLKHRRLFFSFPSSHRSLSLSHNTCLTVFLFSILPLDFFFFPLTLWFDGLSTLFVCLTMGSSSCVLERFLVLR